MPEAYGSILLKTSNELNGKFIEDGDFVSWSTIKELFSFAGIMSPENEHELLRYKVDDCFPHEGIELIDGWLKINVFGDEWMHVMEVLTTKGSSCESYAQIFHEHGVKGFYALNSERERYFEEIDLEGGADSNEGEVVERWLSVVPGELINKFSDVFERDG